MHQEAIRKAAQRQAASSFRLSGLVVPEGYVRSRPAQEFLDQLKKTNLAH